MHDTTGLGEAMAHDYARTQGRDEAVARVAAAAAQVGREVRLGAESLTDVHDHTAALNTALTWERFAALLGWKPPAPAASSVVHPSEADRTTDDSIGLNSLTDLSRAFGGFDGFAGGGGAFGGGGASGAW